MSVTREIGAEILALVRAAQLGENLEGVVIKALSGPNRVLPEGKTSLCAALTSLSYSSASGVESIQVVPAVAAMEMLLAAYDIVDDIEDEEVDPRGDRRSLGHSLEAISTLLLLCHVAISRLEERGIPLYRVLRGLRVFDRLCVDAVRGQTRDVDLEGCTETTIEDSLNTSRLKSASLIRCATELGACLGSDEDAVIDLYARFGWHLGLALQLMNDVEAVWPRGPAKSDIRLRKKTLPVVYALNIPGRSNRHVNVVRAYYAETESVVSEEEVKSALWHCGAIHYTWAVAAREKARALRVAQTLSAMANGRWALAGLLN